MNKVDIMEPELQEHTIEEDSNSFYVDKEGFIPFWDHPLMYGYRKLPKHYYPFTTKEEVIQAQKRGKIREEDMVILKVIGDAIAANEDQIRRYMSRQMSYAETSKRLDSLRQHGFVERWHCRLENDEDEEIRPPAPFTLGIAGFKLLKHYYPQCDFMNPNSWDNKNAKAIQRYVAMNEVRCRFVESRTLRGWAWNQQIGHHNRYRKPLAVAQIETPKGMTNFILERPQMSQNFLGYLKDTLNQWKGIHENNGHIPIHKIKQHPTIVILYASTISLAEKLHSHLLLDNFPFQVWVCVEELLEKEGFEKSFMVPREETLQQVMLPFFKSVNS